MTTIAELTPSPAIPQSTEFKVDALQVRVYSDRQALARAASQEAAEHLRSCLASQRLASVILATGQSQLEFLDRFLLEPDLDWSRIQFFHMDEYLGLPKEHPASFRRYLRERVDRKVASHAFHYLGGDALEPMLECERYAALLQAQPIDLCLLGVGDNGHLAFNDPPVANFEDPYPVKIVKLDEICRQQQVNQGQFPSVEAMPLYAMTLTVPTLCRARRLLCLAPGAHKAGILRTMLHGPIASSCPASVLRRHNQALLLLDPPAASLLERA